MRLQHKVYEFTLIDGDKPMSRLLTSNLTINQKLSDILVSDLFYGIKKEKGNTIKGYSIFEFLDDKGNIQINDKIYNIGFTGDKDNYILKSVSDPKDFVLDDKEMPDAEVKIIEQRIESSAPSEIPKQPQEVQTQATEAGAGESIYESKEYEQERDDLKEEGFKEYLTEPKSNYRCLVKHEEGKEQKLVLIEIMKDDYKILDLDEYILEFDDEKKTFTCEPC